MCLFKRCVGGVTSVLREERDDGGCVWGVWLGVEFEAVLGVVREIFKKQMAIFIALIDLIEIVIYPYLGVDIF